MIQYYVTSVLQYNVGLSRKLSLLLGGVIQIMFVIGMCPIPSHHSRCQSLTLGSFYPTFFSDRFGRRKPMMWGSFGLFISMMMISILLSFKGRQLLVHLHLQLLYLHQTHPYHSDMQEILINRQEHPSRSPPHQPPSPSSSSSCSSSAPRSTVSRGYTGRRFYRCMFVLKGEYLFPSSRPNFHALTSMMIMES